MRWHLADYYQAVSYSYWRRQADRWLPTHCSFWQLGIHYSCIETATYVASVRRIAVSLCADFALRFSLRRKIGHVAYQQSWAFVLFKIHACIFSLCHDAVRHCLYYQHFCVIPAARNTKVCEISPPFTVSSVAEVSSF